MARGRIEREDLPTPGNGDVRAPGRVSDDDPRTARRRRGGDDAKRPILADLEHRQPLRLRRRDEQPPHPFDVIDIVDPIPCHRPRELAPVVPGVEDDDPIGARDEDEAPRGVHRESPRPLALASRMPRGHDLPRANVDRSREVPVREIREEHPMRVVDRV